MENAIFNYYTSELTDYFGDGDDLIIRDFTQTMYTIPSYLLSEQNYNITLVSDDNRLDLISYKHYRTVDYWDIILLYNNMDNPFQLPKNYNFVLQRAEIWYNNWYNAYGQYKPNEYLQQKRAYYTQLSAVENEKFRQLKIPYTSTVETIRQGVFNNG